MYRNLFPVLILAFFLGACSQEPEPVPAQQTAAKNTPQPDGSDEKSEFEKDFAKSLKVILVDPETGEKMEAEATINVVEDGRYILYPEREEAKVSFEGVNLCDASGNPVTIPTGTVTVIEYWSTDGMSRNQYWNRLRALEAQYEGGKELNIYSINFDVSLSGKDQIQEASNFLKDFTPPKRLVFDLNDGIRDHFWVPGPVSYYLIDHRGQLTHAARGDSPAGQDLLDAIDNALLFQKDKKQQNVQVEYKGTN